MKKLLLALLFLGSVKAVPAFATFDNFVGGELNYKEFFKVTEGKVLDWAIASSVEAGYARDMIGGRNAVVGQIPVIYVTPYINGDLGYVTGYDEKSRGSLMVGGTIRLNKIAQDVWQGRLAFVRTIDPTIDGNWDKFWVGPWIAHSFTEDETLGGIKAGLKFDGFLGLFK